MLKIVDQKENQRIKQQNIIIVIVQDYVNKQENTFQNLELPSI